MKLTDNMFKTKPWAHQKKACQYIIDKNLDHFGLFFDMGTGKSKTAVDIWRFQSNLKKRALKCLVITPIVVMKQFAGEFTTHSKIKPWRISVVDGTTKPDGKVLKNPSLKLKKEQLQKDADIFIINTEMVGNKNLWPIIEQLGIEMLICDESHRFKAFNGTRVKALLKFVDTQPRLMFRLILTGTPILNDARDLWSQFYIMDPNIFGKNFYTFLHKYFYDKNAWMPSDKHFPNWQPKDQAYYKKFGLPFEDVNESLNKIIYKHAMRVMKSECLDLPEFIGQELDIPLDKNLSKIYRDMEKDAIAFLESDKTIDESNYLDPDLVPDNVMIADLAIVKIIRLQQLVCGIFTNSEGKVELIPTKRIEVLKGTLEELAVNPENKMIVWTSFTPTYSQIAAVCKELGLNYCFITGEQSYEEKMKSMELFNNDPNMRVCIANQGAGGTGVNLTASNYSIYYSRSFKLEHDLQSEARNYRGGQTRKVTRIDLVSYGTIDEKVLNRLNEKKENAEDILAQNQEFTTSEIKGLLK